MTASIFEEMNTVDKYLFTQLNTVTFSFLYVFKHSQALNLLMQLNSVIDFYVYTAARSDSRYVWGDEHDGHISLCSWIRCPFHFFMCDEHSEPLSLYTVEYDDPFMSYLPGITIMVDWAFKSYLRS